MISEILYRLHWTIFWLCPIQATAAHSLSLKFIAIVFPLFSWVDKVFYSIQYDVGFYPDDFLLDGLEFPGSQQ